MAIGDEPNISGNTKKSLTELYLEELLRKRYNVDELIQGFEASGEQNVKERVLNSLRERAEREDKKIRKNGSY